MSRKIGTLFGRFNINLDCFEKLKNLNHVLDVAIQSNFAIIIVQIVTASLVPMLCLIQVSYIGCNRIKAVFLLTIAVACIGGMYCGFLANHIDIAPNFAGSLVAMTNFVATIPGFVVPVFVGQLTHGNVSN